MPTAQIPLTLYQHPTLSDIMHGKSSRQHPVSTQSWWICFCWLANIGESIGQCCFWVCPCFPTSVLYILLIFLDEMGGKWPYKFLLSRFVQNQHTASLYSSHWTFSLSIWYKLKWFKYTVVMTQLQKLR